jgi:hypothetical protein
MAIPTRTVIDFATGESSVIDFTADEIALWKSEFEAVAEKKAAEEAQAATDKAALLAKLGITADEAKLLLS